MLEKFLPRTEFSSYEDFKRNYKLNIPKNFNFAYDIMDEWARECPNDPALYYCNEQDLSLIHISATMQYMVKRHKRLYKDLHTLPKYVSVQINDTHPTVAIPELMRILMDEEGMGWDEAYRIVSEIFNYTNHTVMAEALECWPKDMFKIMLPRIYSIIETINEKYCAELWKAFPGDFEKISNCLLYTSIPSGER